MTSSWDMPNGHRDPLWHVFEAWARLEEFLTALIRSRHRSSKES